MDPHGRPTAVTTEPDEGMNHAMGKYAKLCAAKTTRTLVSTTPRNARATKSVLWRYHHHSYNLRSWPGRYNVALCGTNMGGNE